MDQSIERDSQCFVCGADNPQGLHLSFTYPAAGKAESSLVVPERFSGWKGVAHGGLLSMLLDEVMAHACGVYGSSAVTGELNVRFRKPVAVGSRVSLAGEAEAPRGRLIATKGWIYDESGDCAAEATARFVLSRP